MAHDGQNISLTSDTVLPGLFALTQAAIPAAEAVYAIAKDKEVAVMESRNMLADMRKLLKLSRIG